ncbi:hypothetical protein AQ623_00625 [Flavobacterium columnare]|nr:hypothetical protein AQ623_00625 [Flavobacterium columnare]
MRKKIKPIAQQRFCKIWAFGFNGKSVLYLETLVKKQKIGTGFPQTSQSHKTLYDSFPQQIAKVEAIKYIKNIG